MKFCEEITFIRGVDLEVVPKSRVQAQQAQTLVACTPIGWKGGAASNPHTERKRSNGATPNTTRLG